MSWDIIIAGGGPAGLTAAIYGARGGWKTLLIDPMGGGGQIASADYIHNYPGFPGGLGGMELTDRMAQQAQEFGAEIRYDQVMAVELDDNGFIIKGENEEFFSKAVVYAAGNSPRRLGIPGEEKYISKGISFCATCDGPLFRDRVVAVVGGGDSALSEARFLAQFAAEVLLIHRRDEFRASMAEVNLLEKHRKIRKLLSHTVQSVEGNDILKSITVRNEKTGGTKQLSVDGLFLYVGWQPNVKPIEGLVEIDSSGFVITNEDMSTKTPGLYVAGDIRKKPLRQVITAASDGAIAAWSAEKHLLELFS